MKIKDTISQMQEVIQYLINHKDNQPDTDFCKNVDKLINLQADLVNGAEKSEANLNIGDVSNCPMWMPESQFRRAKNLYKRKKPEGIKYLTELARPHEPFALKWSKKFLDGCC